MSDTTPEINETDLEVRLSEAIRIAFPSIDEGRLRHQKTFTLKLGHEGIKINGTKPSLVGGRLDILVEIDQVPLAILELKKPGEPLDDAVTKQGLSYARLLDQTRIPPLVIVTNGKECRFYRTWDGTEWVVSNRDAAAVQSLFASAGTASAENLDEAVRHLLEIIPGAWAQAIRSYTKFEIDAITGDIADLSKSVATGFSLMRKAGLGIVYLLANGQNKIALRGEPFSGKTNIMASLCTLPAIKNFCFLYVNLATSTEGVFDRIASALAAEFFRTFPKDQLKTWIINQLQREKEIRLVVLLDGIDSTDPVHYRNDLDFLARQANKGLLHLVIAGHNELIASLCTISGKTTPTVVGEKLMTISLERLDKEELQAVEKLLFENHEALLEDCSDLVLELHEPRILRLLASQLGKVENDVKPSSGQNEVMVLFSTPNPRWFEAFWHIYSTPESREHFRRLGHALMADSLNQVDAGGVLRMRALGALKVETVERLLDSERIKWLREKGFLQFVFRSNGLRLYLPKIPELLVVAAAQIIAEDASKIFHINDGKAAAKHIITQSERLPYNGITCALATKFAGEIDPEILQFAFDALLSSSPRFEKADLEATFGILRPDGNVFKFSRADLKIDEHEQIGTWANIHPWLALSYLITQPMEGSGVAGLRMTTIATVGSSKVPIMGINQSPSLHSGPVEMHEMPGGISLLHGRFALLEPIMEAIQTSMHQHPVEMRLLCQTAVTDLNLPLIYRLLNAVQRMEGSTDTVTSALATELIPALREGLKEAFIHINDEPQEPPRTGQDWQAQHPTIKAETDSNSTS